MKNVEYNPYLELVDKRIWTRMDQSHVRVEDMTSAHIISTAQLLRTKLLKTTIDWEVKLWKEWVDIFECELKRRAEGE